ncbi:DUF2933 domain-containing protein [Streptomyces sp. NBC_01343]|uniref:hypothetical protein n=1 Tax=Streptomyces sp. NBC_01343 TaxID=2903832 RepID=UPI002E1575AA|nr:DUF2933 domain-containing protein [Streptomyces sp. NBC_01343]
MNTNRKYGFYAVAAVIVLVGALAVGVPPAAPAWFAIVGACPLVMFFMMRGVRDNSGGHDMQDTDRTPDYSHSHGRN